MTTSPHVPGGFAEVALPWPAGRQVARLLGGEDILDRPVLSPLDAHDMLVEGLPGAALTHLVDGLTMLQNPADIEKAIGVSVRTVQRRRDDPARRLSQEQSGRAWKFAEILARTTAIMGSQEAAEQWLISPATGLDRRCPIDLLASPSGVEIVEAFLTRMEYGVYT